MNIYNISKQLYSHSPGPFNSFNIHFSSVPNQSELYDYIWIIFMYGLSYFQHNRHPEQTISLNIYNISIKHFDKVIKYMQSIGVHVTLIHKRKLDLENELHHRIKMYNYDKNRYLRCTCIHNSDNSQVNITNIQSDDDTKNINKIFEQIDYLEYLFNIKKKNKKKLYDFEKIISLTDDIYIIRFIFGYQ